MSWGKDHIQSDSMNKLLWCKKVGNEWQHPRTITLLYSYPTMHPRSHWTSLQ